MQLMRELSSWMLEELVIARAEVHKISTKQKAEEAELIALQMDLEAEMQDHDPNAHTLIVGETRLQSLRSASTWLIRKCKQSASTIATLQHTCTSLKQQVQQMSQTTSVEIESSSNQIAELKQALLDLQASYQCEQDQLCTELRNYTESSIMRASTSTSTSTSAGTDTGVGDGPKGYFLHSIVGACSSSASSCNNSNSNTTGTGVIGTTLIPASPESMKGTGQDQCPNLLLLRLKHTAFWLVDNLVAVSAQYQELVSWAVHSSK
jgi:hypothetical protein